jgi:Xaa-Pro aminopeptidase
VNVDPRIAALRRRLAGEEVEAILVTLPVNMRYITGFDRVFDEGIAAVCLVTGEIARSAAEGTPWAVRVQRESMYIELCEELQAEGIVSLALESSVPYGRFKFVSEQFAGRVAVVDQWVEELRQVKETVEIEAIGRAAKLTDAAFEHILGFVTVGMREVDVAVDAHQRRRGRGVLVHRRQRGELGAPACDGDHS